jgi:hypothetical protein
MFEIDPIIVIDLAIVIVAIVTLWYSIRLMVVLDHVRNYGWWTVLPIVLLYGVMNRTVVLLTEIGYTPYSPEFLSAMILPLWVGLLIYVRGLYSSAHDLKELQRVKE